jgi:steroid 5-alpha reductase family enzyme
MDWNLYLSALAVALAIGLAGWLYSLARRNVTIVDSLWSLMFLAMGLVYALGQPALSDRGLLLLALLAVWALRLSIHLTLRNWGQPEDHRYQAIRRNNEPGFDWKSLYLVFGLQAVLAWVISLPLLAATGPGDLGLLDLAAVSLWVVGFIFEALGDRQLARFRADPANAGEVLDSGLWRYTRHPNYFGESCIWWSYYLFALSAGGWWALPAPLLMTWLLLRVSGVAMLEKDIGERRPAYRGYIARTNAFFPGPPRRAAS